MSDISIYIRYIYVCQIYPYTLDISMYVRYVHDKVSVPDRLAQWFGYHLGNWKFEWEWNLWSMVLQLAQDHPKVRFIREVLAKCLRYKYLFQHSQLHHQMLHLTLTNTSNTGSSLIRCLYILTIKYYITFIFVFL